MNLFTLLMKLETDWAAGNYAACWADVIALMQMMGPTPPKPVGAGPGPSWTCPAVHDDASAIAAIQSFRLAHNLNSAAGPSGAINWKGLWALLLQLLPFLAPLVI